MRGIRVIVIFTSFVYLSATLNNVRSELSKGNSNIKMNKKLSNYDSCMKNRSSNFRASYQPTVLTALEGKSVGLQCDICLPPTVTDVDDIVEWYFNSSVDDSLVNIPVSSSDHVIYAHGTLKIFDIEMEQMGRYWCKVNETTAAPYFLHVYNGSEPMSAVRPDEAPNAPHAKPATTLPEYNLQIYSEWTAWSPCSTCDSVGNKVRYGYCTILSLKTTSPRTRPDSNAESLSEIDEYYENENKDDGYEAVEGSEMKSDELRFALETVLPRFGNKLPCRSSYTPLALQNLPAVKSRGSEMMTRYCKIKCQKNVVFEVRDKYGKILESANNSAGIFSMLQKVPEVLPVASHVTLYNEHNAPSKLKCPSTLNSDAPITWKISKAVIDPELIEQQSSGRIKINLNGQIIFEKLRFADANIYSCWQNNKLAGVIRLKVIREYEVKSNNYILMFGGVGIISVFLLVFWRAFQGRSRVPKH